MTKENIFGLPSGKVIICKRCDNTFIASDLTLGVILSSLRRVPNIEVKRILPCDKGGWHIKTKFKSKEVVDKL